MAMQAHFDLPIRSVAIEITPESSGRIISLGSAGELPVTLLGSDDLDVAEVEQSSLHVHGATPVRIEMRDINRDGRLDLVVFFDPGSVRLSLWANKAHLTGWLKSSQMFIGEAQVGILKR